MSRGSLKASLEGIEKARKALQYNGLTQKALAEELGISRSTISNFFNGKNVDRSIFIDEICHRLNLNWQEIFAKPFLSSEESNFESEFTNRQLESAEKTNSFTYKPGTPFQAPPLPSYFVDRPQIVKDLKTRLLANETERSGTLIISAIQGLGGIGKTVLTQALAHDRQIQERFCDGILWATLGQQPDVLFLLQSWIIGLKDYGYKPTTIQAASTHLNSLLYNKAVLLIIDDVWNVEEVEPFQVGGDCCQIIMTTRRADIAEEVGAKLYSLSLMSEAQSLKLLTKRLGRKLAQQEIGSAKQLAKKLGYLPIALDLAAARISRGKTWQELYQNLNAEIARLEVLEGIRRRSKKETRLEASFNLSLNFLRADFPEAWQSFIWLGILPDDVSITAKMTATLWQVELDEASDRLELFWNDALLLPGKAIAGKAKTYRLHDLLHDLARHLLTVQESPGLGLDLQKAHNILLERYQKQLKNGLWHELPDDNYIHDRLTWHMEKAGRFDLIHQLLAEATASGKNGWYQACDRLGKTAIFIADISRAWKSAELAFNCEPQKAIGWQCRYALITSSLNTIAGNIPPKLIAVLIEKNFWTVARGLAYSRQVQNLLQRVQALSKLTSYLPEIGSEALEIASSITEESERAAAIAELAPHLPENLLFQALEIAKNITSQFYRDNAIKKIVPYLSENLLADNLKGKDKVKLANLAADSIAQLGPQMSEKKLSKALENALKITSEFHRNHAIEELAPYLPENLLANALEGARSIKDEFDRSETLKQLALYLPEIYLDALEAAKQITNESDRAEALKQLAPYLPENLFVDLLKAIKNLENESEKANALRAIARSLPEVYSDALEAAKNITNESERAYALTEIARTLPENLFPGLLKAIQDLQDESERANALRAIAPKLPKELLQDALDTANKISNEFYQANLLATLAPKLPKELLQDALETANKISNEFYQANVLRSLGPQLPKELLQNALETANNITNESYRAYALSELTPQPSNNLSSNSSKATITQECDRIQLSQKIIATNLLPDALKEIDSIANESDRVDRLSELAPQLPKELLKNALETANNITNESYRTNALKAIAPQLTNNLLPDLLEVTNKIANEFYRANLLSTIAPQLPKDLLLDALQAANNITNESYRANVLSSYTPNISQKFDIFPYNFWCDLIRSLASLKRKKLLKELSENSQIIKELGGTKTFREIADAIKDVGRWFP